MTFPACLWSFLGQEIWWVKCFPGTRASTKKPATCCMTLLLYEKKLWAKVILLWVSFHPSLPLTTWLAILVKECVKQRDTGIFFFFYTERVISSIMFSFSCGSISSVRISWFILSGINREAASVCSQSCTFLCFHSGVFHVQCSNSLMGVHRVCFPMYIIV